MWFSLPWLLCSLSLAQSVLHYIFLEANCIAMCSIATSIASIAFNISDVGTQPHLSLDYFYYYLSAGLTVRKLQATSLSALFHQLQWQPSRSLLPSSHGKVLPSLVPPRFFWPVQVTALSVPGRTTITTILLPLAPTTPPALTTGPPARIAGQPAHFTDQPAPSTLQVQNTPSVPLIPNLLTQQTRGAVQTIPAAPNSF